MSKADPSSSKRPTRRIAPVSSATLATRAPRKTLTSASLASRAGLLLDADFGLALCVVPALRRRPDA